MNNPQASNPTDAAMHPWIGRLIGEPPRYRLDHALGSGGMGNVFLAMDIRVGQSVAVKVLRELLATEIDVRSRFDREFAICAALKSQHIVQVRDYGVTPEGHPFYVMEYLQGETLGQLLRRSHRLSVEQSLRIAIQVCAGLQQAHEGVVLCTDTQGTGTTRRVQVTHRDLKPDNIFLVPTALGEFVKIIDFGVAKMRSLQAEQTKATSVFLGTWHYAAPEQFEADASLDGRADMYSLGMVLYQMLTGCDPFGFGLKKQKVSGSSWALAHTAKSPLPLRSHPGCEPYPASLEAVVMRCLEKLPEQRFTSIQALSQALLQVLHTPDLDPTDANSLISREADPPATIASLNPLPTPLPLTQVAIPPPNSKPASGATSCCLSQAQHHQLEQVLTRMIGPIAPLLLTQMVQLASTLADLREQLATTLPSQTVAELQPILQSWLLNPTQALEVPEEPPPVAPPVRSPSRLSEKFVQHCQQQLTQMIGPIAPFLVQNVLKTHPQVSETAFIELIVAQIPDSKQAQQFRQKLLV